MSGLQERGKAFENKYAHDEETIFKLRARRNHYFGEWVAGILGKTGRDRENYILDIVKLDLEAPGDESILMKVQSDISSAGLKLKNKELEQKLEAISQKLIKEAAT